MSRKILGCMLFLTGLGFSCSRDASSILVKLDHPIYNRYPFRLPGQDTSGFDPAPGPRTIIFDTEQMTTLPVSIRAGDLRHRRSQFRIALVDYNDNGQFDEAGVDKFLLERYGRDSSLLIYPFQPNIGALTPYAQFRVDRQAFEIGAVDPKGHTLEIYPIGRSDALAPVVFNTYLPNLHLRDSTGQEQRLADLQQPGKPLVIVLWQNRHQLVDQQVEELLAAHVQTPDRLTIIGLHIPGPYFRHPHLEDIQAWLKGRMPLYWGKAEHVRELNGGDQWPNLILFNTDGVWQGAGLRTADILREIENY